MSVSATGTRVPTRNDREHRKDHDDREVVLRENTSVTTHKIDKLVDWYLDGTYLVLIYEDASGNRVRKEIPDPLGGV